ncbi:divergent polysaccharide deacetylase family protein [Ponticaulis profundi]|uniref:Divergent polysaccharide deacetylase family protein n=1 Tax=Ponticaulis profundi TaxID=2665222 RepID=A0ABW1SDM4_9PROT
MAAKRKLPPSPLQTGLNHAALSLLAFGGIVGVIALSIQLMGKEDHASPKQIVGLFSEEPRQAVGLKERLSDSDAHHPSDDEHGPTLAEMDEPSLGISDPGTADPHETDDSHGDDPHEDDTPSEYAQAPSAAGLPRAPIEGLYEAGAYGKMPIIAADGRTPFDVYKRPFSNPAGRPTISIVIGGLGLNSRVTQAAIDELPPGVTLSFVPYSKNLQTWIDKARAAGHEVMIEFPMEPYDYPNNDTGPYTLLTTANASENRRRAEWLLSQATGYYGVTNYQGAKYATDARAVSPVFEMLKERGLVFMHDGSAPRSVFETVAKSEALPFAEASRVVDADPSGAAIDEQLLYLEAIALQRGYALGTGFAFPITVDQIRDWSSTLDSKGYVLAPASALPRAQPELGSSGVRSQG